MTIHPQDVQAMLGRGPGGTPVNREQLDWISEVLNDARADHVWSGDQRPDNDKGTHLQALADSPIASQRRKGA